MTRTGTAEGYPANWREISARIRARSEGRCECSGQCGLHRDRRCIERNGELASYARGRIMLTTAHFPDHNPANCADDNLIAACQRCHLRMDVPQHQASARATRRNRKAIGELFAEKG